MSTISRKINRYRSLFFFLSLVVSISLKVTAQNKVKLRLTAKELFNLADSNSKAMELSLTNLAVSRANLEEVKNSRLPHLFFSASAGYLSNVQVLGLETMLSGSYDMPHFSNSYGIEASYVIFSGGNISRNIEMAALQEKLAGLNYEKDRADIRLVLIGHLIDLFVAQNQREVYQKIIEQTSKLLATMEERQKEGIVLRSDVIRTQLQLSNFSFELSRIENQISVINRKLTETLGLEKTVEIVADENLLEPASTYEVALPSYKNNVELRESDLRIHMAEKHTGTIKARKLPEISLYGASNFSRPFIYDLPALDIYANLWTAGVSLSFNISSLYTNDKSEKKARLQESQSRLAKDLIEEHVRIKLHEAYVNYEESLEHLAVAKKEQELAAVNYSLVSNRYNAQLALITDLMDASTNRLRADLQIQNAEAAISFAIYNIKRIQGEL